DRAVGRRDDVRGGLDAVAVRQTDGEDRRVGAGALEQRKGVRAPQRLADDFAAGGPDRAAKRRAGALVVVENRHAPARTSSHALCSSQAECQTSPTSKISHLGRAGRPPCPLARQQAGGLPLARAAATQKNE